jgi:SAM-dependent methyltransferase
MERAYQERDRGTAPSPYTFASAGYAFHMQRLEWSLLEVMHHSPVAVDEARVLDIGCGSGYFLHRLLEFGAATGTGVDLSQQRIDSAQQRYPTARFLRANAAQLPFADSDFDIVTQFTCLSSVLDGGLRAAIAGEMWRVLRPGGIVLSYDMRPEPSALRAKRRLLNRALRSARSTETPAPTVGISVDEVRRLFPSGRLQWSPVGLDFELCVIAERSYLMAHLLACVPFLRAHAIALVLKPS